MGSAIFRPPWLRGRGFGERAFVPEVVARWVVVVEAPQLTVPWCVRGVFSRHKKAGVKEHGGRPCAWWRLNEMATWGIGWYGTEGLTNAGNTWHGRSSRSGLGRAISPLDSQLLDY